MNVLPYNRPADTADVPLERRHRWLVLLAEVGQLAHAIANTEFVPKGLRGDEAKISAAILYGDEIGLPPMQALAKIAVIDGKPSIAAEGQRALIQAAGHTLRGEGTNTKFTWWGTRADNGQSMNVTWTLDDAKRAKLDGKQNWRMYPRAMLSARASAELARALFADVIGGLAATEELEDTGPGGDAPREDEPTAPAPSSRRRRPAPIIAPTIAGPDEPPEPPLDDEPPATPKASQAQLNKMFALFGQLGMRDRDTRLAWATERLGRPITTAYDLTDLEASALIGALEQEQADADTAAAAATEHEQQTLGGD